MLKRFVPILVLAFVTGVLFRLAAQYDAGFLRMFGTWGIVAIGLWGARILKDLQVDEGVRLVEESFAKCGEGVRVQQVSGAGPLPMWIVETPRGKVLIGTSDVAHAAKKSRAERALCRQARAMLQSAQARGVIQAADRFSAALVLLRKKISETGKIDLGEGAQVSVVSPEHLASWLQAAR